MEKTGETQADCARCAEKSDVGDQLNVLERRSSGIEEVQKRFVSEGGFYLVAMEKSEKKKRAGELLADKQERVVQCALRDVY